MQEFQESVVLCHQFTILKLNPNNYQIASLITEFSTTIAIIVHYICYSTDLKCDKGNLTRNMRASWSLGQCPQSQFLIFICPGTF